MAVDWKQTKDTRSRAIRVLGAAMLLLLAPIVGAGFPLVQTQDCSTASELHAQGLAARLGGDQLQAIELFEQANTDAACQSYENWFVLGKAYQAQAQQADAQLAFKEAMLLAGNNSEWGSAVGRFAQTREAQGDSVEALVRIQEARQVLTDPPPWMNEMALRLDQASMTEGKQFDNMEKGLQLESFVVGAKPPTLQLPNPTNIPSTTASMQARILFEFDKATVITADRVNVERLAQALARAASAGQRVYLIGHADERGSEAYNQDLSERRARTIRDQLVAMQPTLRDRLQTRGDGERRPLYRGHTEQEYLLNRRLEVVLD